MSMVPDARQDLAGAINYLISLELENRESRSERKLSTSAMSRELGYSADYLRRPWRQPGFGAAGTMYTRREWEAWLERPEAERRAEWDRMSASDRARARGKV